MENFDTDPFLYRKLISESVLEENKTWIIAGFLRVFKKVGSIYFGIISDASGQIQVIFKEPLLVNKESVLLICGKLVKRKSVNKNIKLGEWELLVEKYEILSEAKKTLPFEINNLSKEPSEPTRLKYRYLDIRRSVHKNLLNKSKILNYFRNFLIDESFIEIHTPVLSISSKEGANTFDVEVFREKKKSIFSLSQSPQLYKQLLMCGGIERYFQIANCFRLEDLRSDRQYEFLQIDIEVSFFSREKFFNLIENIFKKLLDKLLNHDFVLTNLDVGDIEFKRISYKDSLEKYGSDKPDLRHDYEIENLTKNKDSFLSNCLISFFNKKYTEVFGLFLPNCGINVVEDKWLSSIVTKNEIYILKIKNKKIVEAHVMKKDMPEVDERLKIKLIDMFVDRDDGVLLVSPCCWKTKKNVLLSLGELRLHFSRKTNKELFGKFEFVWIIDWPLFEYNESKNDWIITHHLFTRPKSNKVGFDYKTEMSCGYDLVLNGVELGSGSERNNDLYVQKYIFEVVGYKEEDMEKEFGWFLEAFNYGVPNHMGIAIGVDRLVQILLNLSSIREVIAFPKNNHGICPLTNSPLIIE